MAGELWLQFAQVAKEATPGTAVPATRRLYTDATMTRQRTANLIKVQTGTRDNQRDVKLHSVQAGGKLTQNIAADEMLEMLLSSVNGGVTGTQNGVTGQYNWIFAPGNTLDSQTYEWHDGQRGWQLYGTLIDELKLSGTVSGDATVEATLFGRELVQHTMTPALAQRTPNFMQGWNVKVYIDAFGGTAGTTVVPATMISWDVDIKNGAKRKYFADNTTATGAVVVDALSIQTNLVLEANASAFTEYGNWDAVTKRLVRLELGNSPNDAVIGTSTIKPTIWIDLPGAWTAVDLSGSDNGTRTYKLSLDYVYDATNAYGVQITVKNSRATAY